MLRGLRLTLALTSTALLCVLGAMVMAEPASAKGPGWQVGGEAWGVLSPHDGLTNRERFNILYNGTNPDGTAATSAQAVAVRDRLASLETIATSHANPVVRARARAGLNGFHRLRQSFGAFPKLRALGTIAMTASAFDFGWRIGRTIDEKFLHLSSDSMPVENATWTVKEWVFVEAGPFRDESGWILIIGAPGSGLSQRDIFQTGPGGEPCNSSTCPGGQSSVHNAYRTEILADEASTEGAALQDYREATNQGSYSCGSGPTAGECLELFIPEAAMEEKVGALAEPVTYTTQTINRTTNITVNHFEESDEGTSVETDAKAKVAAAQPQPGVEDVAEAAGDPANDQNPFDDDVQLPAPDVGEGVEHYITRLRTLGWIGDETIVYLTETTGKPVLGPGAPVTITFNPADTTEIKTISRPAQWPSPEPLIDPTSPIDFTANPSTFPPIDPTKPIPGEGDPGGVDFTPITGIDFGCKFPYGLICYAVDVTETFNVAPDAPVFTFSLGTTEVGEAPYVVDLAVMDAYMSILRTLISVALWVGGVYFLASSLLGFRMGGDPGEAADAGMDW